MPTFHKGLYNLCALFYSFFVMNSPFLRFLNQTAFENAHDKGNALEEATKHFLTHDVVQQRRFADVWLWNDYPDRKGRPDTGIDLVAREHENDRMIAIQCKFYSSGNVGWHDISTFVATCSSSGEFAAGILVITTNLTKTVRRNLRNIHPPIEVWRPEKFDASNINWDNRTTDGDNSTYQSPLDDQDSTAKSHAEDLSDPFYDQDFTAEPHVEEPPVPTRHIQPQPIPYRSQPAYVPPIESYPTYQSPNKKHSSLSRNPILIVLGIIAGVIGVAAAIMFFIRVEGALNIVIAIGIVLGIFALFGVFQRR